MEVVLEFERIADESRLFFVVDSREKTPELFLEYGDALKYYRLINENVDSNVRMRLCIVNGAHQHVLMDSGEITYSYDEKREDAILEIGELHIDEPLKHDE